MEAQEVFDEPLPVAPIEVIDDQGVEEPLIGDLERPFFEMERLESSNYLVETSRTEHCCSFAYTWLFYTCAAITLYFLIIENSSIRLLGVIIPSICFALCYCVTYDIRKDPEFKRENWKTFDEAIDIIETGVKNRPVFEMKMKRLYEYRNDATLNKTVSANYHIDNWLDYSTPVNFLIDRSKILKINIRKFYRIDGNYTTFTQNVKNFEQQTRQQNVRYSNTKAAKYDVENLPDVIMVNPADRNEVRIPWYYNQICYYTTQLCCCASYLWKRLVSSCCTEQLVYTSLKVFRDDDKLDQEQIDILKQEWIEDI